MTSLKTLISGLSDCELFGYKAKNYLFEGPLGNLHGLSLRTLFLMSIVSLSFAIAPVLLGLY